MNYQNNSSNSNNEVYTTYQGWESMIRVSNEEEEMLITGLRKGPWTAEEDSKLTSSIAFHGEGRWNTLAFLAGLKRSGKSCRLRWLNYLRPDLRHDTLTLDEQLLILQLHFRWGNRWSKIAEHLPGRTDNEIKNYWRTKVQKLARQFQCHVNSPEFRDTLRHIWIPRLVEQIQAGANLKSNTTNSQIEGSGYECRHGLIDNNSSSENCCLFDVPTSWAQYSMDHHVVGPSDLGPKPNILANICEAHISPESGSSADLDKNWEQIIDLFYWEMTQNDGDNTLFFDQHYSKNKM